MSGDRAWFEAAFGSWYETVYAHRDDASALAEVAGLLPRLREGGGPVLDACCGGGRHLAAMRAAGLATIGFDLSRHLLGRAAGRASVRGRIARADVRRLPFLPEAFSAVTLLFTAFGYFDEAANADTLAGLARLLAPDGWLLLDLPDPDQVRTGLVPISERTGPEGLRIVEHRRLEGARVLKEVRIRRGDEVVATWEESVRLYEDDHVEQLANEVGLEPIEAWSSLRGPNLEDGRRVWWLRRTLDHG